MRFEFPRVGAAAMVTVVAGATTLWGASMIESFSADTPRLKIAVVMSSETSPYQAALDGFRESLAHHGIDATYDIRALHDDPVESVETVRTMTGSGARLLYTLGAVATQAVVDAGADTPLVACLLLNTSDINTLPRAVGVALEIPVDTQFQWLRRFLPDAKRVGVLYNQTENQGRIDAASRVARKMGLTLSAQAIETPRDIPGALNRLANEVDVLWGLPDRIALSPATAKPLLLFSLRNRIPFVGLSASWAKAGALYALDRDYADLGAQCGEMAMMILDGRSPDSLHPAFPRKVLYAINLKTARHMKVTVPDALVRGASDVFE